MIGNKKMCKQERLATPQGITRSLNVAPFIFLLRGSKPDRGYFKTVIVLDGAVLSDEENKIVA